MSFYSRITHMILDLPVRVFSAKLGSGRSETLWIEGDYLGMIWASRLRNAVWAVAPGGDSHVLPLDDMLPVDQSYPQLREWLVRHYKENTQ